MEQLSTKLYIEKSIDVAASSKRLWKVITHSELNQKWIDSWWADVSLESDWQLGSPVVWKLKDGRIGATGKVLFVDPEKVLRFSFRPNGNGQLEEITFVFHQMDEHTHFTVASGNFADNEQHHRRYKVMDEVWSRSLPQIKLLAEKKLH